MVWEVTGIEGGMDEATAELRATIMDLVIDYVWNCSAGQGMASFDFANLGIAPADAEMTIENQAMEGVFLLPADELQPGANWTMVLSATFAFKQEAGGTEIEVTGTMTSDQLFTVAGNDPIIFEELTVDGVQVGQLNTITMAMGVMGSGITQEIAVSGTYELGWGIGMLGQVFDTDFGTDSLELVSYSIP